MQARGRSFFEIENFAHFGNGLKYLEQRMSAVGRGPQRIKTNHQTVHSACCGAIQVSAGRDNLSSQTDHQTHTCFVGPVRFRRSREENLHF